MTNVLKSKIAKAGFGLLVGVFALAGTASAMTTAEAQALVTGLGLTGTTASALVAALTAGNSTTANTNSGSCYTFTTALSVGSKGEAVTKLQMALGISPATGYFGNMTKQAVMNFQTSKGLSPVGMVGPATRSALNNMCATGGSTSNNGGSTATGPVTAMIATDNPMAGTVVAGQATATLTKVTFSGAGTVTGVTLQRTGISADTTLSNVYLFDGATRLTDAASVSSNGTVTFSVPAGIFTVAGSKTISLKSDIAGSTSGQTVGLNLTGFTTSAGTSTATVAGNVHSIASATLASVTHSTVTPSGATINPAAGVTLWQDTLTISTRDVWMKRIALRNVGSAPASAFANFKLYVSGTQVGSVAGLNADGYATFDLSAAPVLLLSGSRTIRVDADVVSGASRTVQFSLRNAADVDFVDSSFGVNVAPTSTPWSAASASTISGSTGGTLTIEKDVTSPSTNVTLAGSDVTLGVFKVTAYGEPIKVETLTGGFTFTDGGTANAAATLRNGRLLLSTNGTSWTQYGSTATLVAAGTSYTLNYTVAPGTPVWVKLNADIYDNDGTESLDSSDTLLGKIIAGSSNAQRVDSLGSFSTPASAVSANTVSVASASATLTKNSSYTNQSVALPSTAFKVGSWNLTASSVEDVLLTTLSFDVDEVTVSADDFNESDLTNMYVVLKNNGTVVAQPSPIATVSATDNNFAVNYTLAKNSNISIELFANLGSTVTTGEKFKTDLTVTGTALVSGSSVTATSADTDGQTMTAATASLTATLDASAAIAGIVYDNQTVTTAAFKYAALTAAYNVTDISVRLAGTNALTVAQFIQLYDGATMIASQPVGGSTTTFSGLNWAIPANTNKVLTVKLVLGGVGVGAGSTAAVVTTEVTAFTAVNQSTGVSAAGTESDPSGNAIYAYAATPTLTNVALPTTTLATGTQTVAKFTVTSNGGTIAWKKFILTIAKNISGTDTLASMTVYDGETNQAIAGTAAFTGSVETDSDTAGGATFVATNEQEVNGTKTYYVKMTIAGTLASGDNLSVNIAQPTSFATSTAYATVAATSATFVWSDESASGHSTSTSDWNNEFLMKNLPNDTQTLSY